MSINPYSGWHSSSYFATKLFSFYCRRRNCGLERQKKEKRALPNLQDCTAKNRRNISSPKGHKAYKNCPYELFQNFNKWSLSFSLLWKLFYCHGLSNSSGPECNTKRQQDRFAKSFKWVEPHLHTRPEILVQYISFSFLHFFRYFLYKYSHMSFTLKVLFFHWSLVFLTQVAG